MEVDGKAIAEDLLKEVDVEVGKLGRAPRLSAITCAPNFETKKYLQMKREKAASVGIVLNVVELPSDATTKEVIDCIDRVAKESDGLVVQLPLPSSIDSGKVLEAVPLEKDPDSFRYESGASEHLPPVVGAIDEISKKYKIDWKDKKVVVLGNGRLVGSPASYYAKEKGADVTVLDKETFDENVLKPADIIVSGVGHPNLIEASFVKEGVVIFDAGTSEEGGVLVGDAHKAVFDKASYVTPVPGGIGPITIAYLLRNLVDLTRTS